MLLTDSRSCAIIQKLDVAAPRLRLLSAHYATQCESAFLLGVPDCRSTRTADISFSLLDEIPVRIVHYIN